ncbi:hypothetical protein QE152_g13482 [Popillia japonica]|uniref:Uncharacterized protein n=1 Tax=Popillia japonica TaxID=7064 RepID=A0AAW1LDW4_POPJA
MFSDDVAENGLAENNVGSRNLPADRTFGRGEREPRKEEEVLHSKDYENLYKSFSTLRVLQKRLNYDVAENGLAENNMGSRNLPADRTFRPGEREPRKEVAENNMGSRNLPADRTFRPGEREPRKEEEILHSKDYENLYENYKTLRVLI